jgi:hypothetical protein
MSDLSLYTYTVGNSHIPLDRCIIGSTSTLENATFIRNAWEGGVYAFYLQEGINYKERQYNVFCSDKEGSQLFLGVVSRVGKSWKYRTPYYKNNVQIKSRKKSGSIIKAVRSMFLRLGIIVIHGALSDNYNGLYVTAL